MIAIPWLHAHTLTVTTVPPGCMGDTQFHFRIRCSGVGAGGAEVKFSRDHHGSPLVLMVSGAAVWGVTEYEESHHSDF